jgi:hypothetical protein
LWDPAREVSDVRPQGEGEEVVQGGAEDVAGEQWVSGLKCDTPGRREGASRWCREGQRTWQVNSGCRG